MYGSCADPTGNYRQRQGEGQFFLDIDRNVRVPVKVSICYLQMSNNQRSGCSWRTLSKGLVLCLAVGMCGLLFIDVTLINRSDLIWNHNSDTESKIISLSTTTRALNASENATNPSFNTTSNSTEAAQLESPNNESSKSTTIDLPDTPAPTTMEWVPPMLENKPKGTFKPQNIRFLTLADDKRHEICTLAASIYQQGNVLEVMGWDYSDTFFDGTSCGTRCHTPPGNTNNRFGQEKKLYWLLHYIEKKPDLHDDDLVLFTDAWDVIVNGDTTKLTELFLKHTNHERGIIFNGEPTCGDSFGIWGSYGDKLRNRNWRIKFEKKQTERGISGNDMCSAIAAKTLSNTLIPGPNWSLGSGGILGDVKSIREFLQRVHQIRKEQEDEYNNSPINSFLFEGDQILFQIAYLRFPDINVKIDANSEIFFVISYYISNGDFNEFIPGQGCTSNYMANGTSSRFAWNDVAPVFFHFPGGYKYMFDSCARPTIEYRRQRGAGQYFIDVDRSTNVSIKSICSSFA
ncbi:hypothetical protein THRCLA_01931 [Thraustotheca clavata]|uniref:PLOD1-3-like GT domain-containing protein n=1 Tax=Thraustotheca clavata TaxID=74557 RepID=A0A1W0A733_9STRA|nr:hypothetical protein THRCLA_01931 [Thraustotheca clavata]